VQLRAVAADAALGNGLREKPFQGDGRGGASLSMMWPCHWTTIFPAFVRESPLRPELGLRSQTVYDGGYLYQDFEIIC